MNEVQLLQKLAAAAARETVPRVNVSTRPYALLEVVEDDVSRPLGWMAAFSSAFALPVLLIAAYWVDAWLDPMLQILALSGTVL
jgi:hypothetical protein